MKNKINLSLLGIGYLTWEVPARPGLATVATLLLVGLTLNFLLLFGLSALVQGFWAWFVPVVFPGLPHSIPFWHAFAVTFLLLMYRPRAPGKSEK